MQDAFVLIQIINVLVVQIALNSIMKMIKQKSVKFHVLHQITMKQNLTDNNYVNNVILAVKRVQDLVKMSVHVHQVNSYLMDSVLQIVKMEPLNYK